MSLLYDEMFIPVQLNLTIWLIIAPSIVVALVVVFTMDTTLSFLFYLVLVKI